MTYSRLKWWVSQASRINKIRKSHAMSNSFDFELVAGDHVSEAIAQIDEAVRNLEPQLEKTTGLAVRRAGDD
jgi:hypothetical protein